MKDKKIYLTIYGLVWGPIILSFIVGLSLAIKTFKTEKELSEEYFLKNYENLLAYHQILETKEEIKLANSETPFFIKKEKKNLASIKIQKIKLGSTIILKHKKACLINDKIYREGDWIEEGRILKIGKGWVKLKVKDKEVLLHVGEEISV